jgi:ABC-type transporter Mla MlaB component
MAFSLFSKPTNKPKAGAPARKTPVKQPAAAVSPANDSKKPDSTVPPRADTVGVPLSVNHSWKPMHSAIEVAEGRTELCSALENAALFYGNGQVDSARQTLAEAVVSDVEARHSMLAWLALFDLLQRAGDKPGFDVLALRFAPAFERSPPVWEEHRAGVARPSPSAKTAGTATVRFAGSLAGDGLSQLDALFKATATTPKCKLDFSAVTAVDETLCRMLAETLRALRHKAYPLQIQGAQTPRTLLEGELRVGEPILEGYWLLLLELLQWTEEHDAFDEHAVNYAVSFEVSPPSWEGLTSQQKHQQGNVVSPDSSDAPAEDADAFACHGVMVGPSEAQIIKLREFVQDKRAITVDFSAVERIDFVCAGALLNVLEIGERAHKPIQIIGASAIVQALLLVIGVKQSCFPVKSRG